MIELSERMRVVAKYVTFLFLFLLTGMNSQAQKSKARGQFLSLNRNTVVFKGNKNGFDFKDLKFKYQFLTCDGKVLLGVAYDKKAMFTKYWKDGKSFTKQEKGAKNWPKPEDVRLKDIHADLYFGSRKLGFVRLRSIPEYYQGCTSAYDAFFQVGINNKESVYKTNINKLSLRNIKIAEAYTK